MGKKLMVFTLPLREKRHLFRNLIFERPFSNPELSEETFRASFNMSSTSALGL